MNSEVINKARKALASKRRYHVRLSDVLAVVDRESGGVACFEEGDSLFRDNLASAAGITGYTIEQIRAAIVIPQGAFQGRPAKFRCERDYWDWAKRKRNVDDGMRFLLSCSVGLGQKMVRLYIQNSRPVSLWAGKIHNFMGSEDEQLAYVAGDLEQALKEMHDDRPHAFARYNAGSDPQRLAAAIESYGRDVAARAARFERMGL